MFPEVTSQIEGDGEAITPETFRKLLSEIKEKEMAGALQVMTYYQYYQYRVQCQAEAEALKLEYEIFCQQKDARIKELDEEIDQLKAKLAEEGYNVGKINVDDEGELAERYHVMNIPTLIIFKNGEEKERMVGVQSKDLLESKLKALA